VTPQEALRRLVEAEESRRERRAQVEQETARRAGLPPSWPDPARSHTTALTSPR